MTARELIAAIRRCGTLDDLDAVRPRVWEFRRTASWRDGQAVGRKFQARHDAIVHDGTRVPLDCA